MKVYELEYNCYSTFDIDNDTFDYVTNITINLGLYSSPEAAIKVAKAYNLEPQRSKRLILEHSEREFGKEEYRRTVRWFTQMSNCKYEVIEHVFTMIEREVKD